MNIEPVKDDIEKLLSDSWRQLDMMPVLEKVKSIMPSLLQDRASWRSYLIDYEPPYLMRIFRPLSFPNGKSVYISGHYFFSTEAVSEQTINASNPYFSRTEMSELNPEKLNLYHPHSWAAGFEILDGEYKQLVATAETLGLSARPDPQQGEWRVQSAGSKYAFNDPHIWHMVVPQGKGPVVTLMVTYRPDDWNQESPKPSSDHTLRALTNTENDFMFSCFGKFFPPPRPAFPFPGL